MFRDNDYLFPSGEERQNPGSSQTHDKTTKVVSKGHGKPSRETGGNKTSVLDDPSVLQRHTEMVDNPLTVRGILNGSEVTGIGGDHSKSITDPVRKLPGVSITMVNAYTWALSAITPKRQVTYVMLILSKCLKLKL